MIKFVLKSSPAHNIRLISLYFKSRIVSRNKSRFEPDAPKSSLNESNPNKTVKY